VHTITAHSLPFKASAVLVGGNCIMAGLNGNRCMSANGNGTGGISRDRMNWTAT